MAISQSQVPLTHMFAELSSLEDLKFPVQRSSRLQYTCLSVSQRYIALGSNTGGVYIFSRESLKHLQVVFGDVEVSMVTATALSPNDQNVALAVSSGQVIVMELNIERRVRPERLRQTSDHTGATVTAMVWNSSSSCLFVADSQGKVTLINVPSSKAKTLFTTPSETVVRLDSSVYQLDWWGTKLLVSTVSRTYLFNTARHQFSQIGQKARDGEFGACFFLEPSSNYPVIYCARPGSRMWEVDFEGKVLNTHQFKQSLATLPLPIISQSVNLEDALHCTWSGPQSVNFQKMFRLGEFILTWSNRGIYVFDPINVKVVLWTDTFQGGITDMCVVKNEVYIFLKSQEVRHLVFLPIFLMCSALTSRSRCGLAAQLLFYMESFALRPTLLKRIKKELVPQLMTHLLAEGHSDLAEKVSGLLDDVSVTSVDSDITQEESASYPQYSTQLSGILVVNDGSITSVEKGAGWRSVTPVNFTLEHKSDFEQQNVDRKQTLQWTTTSEILSDSDCTPEPIETRTHRKYISEYVCIKDNINEEMNNNVEQVLVKDLGGDNKNVEQQTSNYDDADVDDTLTDNFKAEADDDKCKSSEKIDSSVNVEDGSPLQESSATQENASGLEETLPCHSREDIAHGSGIERTAELNKCLNELSEYEEDANQGAVTQENDACGVTEGHPSPDKMAERAGMLERANSSPGLQVDEPDASTVEKGSGNSPNHVDFDAESSMTPDASGEASHGQSALEVQMKKKKKVRANEVDISGGNVGIIKRSFSTGTLKKTKKKERRLEHVRSLESVEDMENVTGLYVQTDAHVVSPIGSIDEQEAGISEEVFSVSSALSEDIHAVQAFGEDVSSTVKSSVTSMTDLPNSKRFSEIMQSSSEGWLLAHGSDTQKASTRQEATNVDSSLEVQTFTEGEVTIESDSGFHSPLEMQQSRGEVEVIPPLLQRLSAVGVAPTAGGTGEKEALGSEETSVRGLLAGATRHGRNLLSVKDRVSTKITNTTKSLIKRVREKNLLPSRFPSGTPPTGNFASHQSPHADPMRAQSPVATLQEPAVEDEGDVPDPEIQIDLTSFWAKTTQTQKELGRPYVLLNAKLLNDVLNSWAHELNKALLAYHTESYKNQQRKKKEQEGNSKVTTEPTKELSRNEEPSMREIWEEDGEEKSEVFDTARQAVESSSNEDGENVVSELRQADAELVSIPEDEKKVVNLSKTGEAVNVNQSRSIPDDEQTGMNMLPDSPDFGCDVVTPADQSPAFAEATSDYEEGEKDKWCAGTDPEVDDLVLSKDWSEICHTQDPFCFTQQEHMMVSTLALHCLRAGCFGDVLSVFSSREMGPKKVHADPGQISLSSSFTSTKFEPHSQLQDRKVVRRDVLLCVDQLSDRTEAPEKKSCSNSSSDQVVPAADLTVSREPEHGSSGDVSVEGDVAVGDSGSRVNFLKSDYFGQSGVNQAVQDMVQDQNASPAGALRTPMKDGTSQEEDKDRERALFIQLHFHLLPHWRVRRLVTEMEGRVFQTWCSLITCYKSLGMGDIVWMKLSEKDVAGALDYLRSGILPQKVAFLGHIASAFALSPVQVVEFAAEVPRQVTLRDVLYLCQLLNKPRLKVVTRYLTLRLISVFDYKNKSFAVIQEMCKTLEGKLAVLEFLLSLQNPLQSVTATSSFLRGGADNSKLPPDVLEEVLHNVLSLVKDSEVLFILDVCWYHKYWPGCLSLLARSNQWERALQLAVQLDDISLLDGSREYGFMPRNVAEWKYLFQLYAKQSCVQGQTSPTSSRHEFADTKFETAQIQNVLGRLDGVENAGEAEVQEKEVENVVKENVLHPLGGGIIHQKESEANPPADKILSRVSDSASKGHQQWHRASDFKDSSVTHGSHLQASSSVECGTSQQKLSWATLGLLASHQVGAMRAVGLLEECLSETPLGGSEGGISEEFYNQCITISVIQQRQKLVIHNMLEKVDSYLWAKKPVHLPPQVHYAVMREKAAVEIGRTEGHYQDLFAKLSSAPLPELPLAEDPDCHWGVPVNLNSLCQLCQVHVTETVSHMEPGVLVFRCGHIFHKFCVPDQVCPLC